MSSIGRNDDRATGVHPDDAARMRIRTALDETLFVEAGAGSGKTRALVERVLALVLDGHESLANIAAITFTEKAAAELRDRIRGELESVVRRGLGTAGQVSITPDQGSASEVVARARQALDDLDGAAIGTLHSFAQRILSEHPVEAGLPPRIEVVDEVASTLAFDDRWSGFLDDILDNPELARPILLLTAAGVRLPALREIALSFDDNWDLVAERAPAEAEGIPAWELDLDRLLDDVDEVTRERANCHDDTDPLCGLLDQLADWAGQVRTAPDESARLALCMTEGGRPRTSPNGKGAKPRWTGGYDLPALRARVVELLDRCEQLANHVAHAALVEIAVELRRFTLSSAEERRREGRLEFHDLLVMARQLLRDPRHGPTVRATLADRYRRLLVDEFQDTDPIQVELAVRIATLGDDSSNLPPEGVTGDALRGQVRTGHGQQAPPWQQLGPQPGRLFFVGDPKQSIYRFRRADIALFLEVAERFGGEGHRLALTTNHRSGTQLVGWINQTFDHLFASAPGSNGTATNGTNAATTGEPTDSGNTEPTSQPAPEARPIDRGTGASSRDSQLAPEARPANGGLGAGSARSQPQFEASVAVRPDAPVGPPVTVIGREAHTDKPSADDLRAREAGDVAAAVRRILDEGWLVDRSTDWQQPDWQPARAGDVTILIPARMSLPFLEDSLAEAEIGYRAESASLVYANRLVRDLFLTLRAVDDPSDELCVIAALCSALFGCGDDDLFTFRELFDGSFDHSVPLPDDVPSGHPVAEGLTYLHRLHEARRWHSVSELVDRVVRERRVLELGIGDGNGAGVGNGRARDLWQRVRFVVDQARAWTDTTGGTLRRYLDWVRHQSAPGSRVAEAVLPETDDDAVRIMTVHAAKGLQFPITVLAGLSTYPQGRPSGAQVVWPPEGPCILKVGRKVTSPAYEAWRPLDEQMSLDERIRLLYVAATRARDHLVVSLHRRERAQAPTSRSRLTNAELLTEALSPNLDNLPDATPKSLAPPQPTKAHPNLPPEDATDDTLRGQVPPPAEPDEATSGLPPNLPPGDSTEDAARRHADEVEALPPFDEWQHARDAALVSSGRPRTVAATALTDEGRPDEAEAVIDPGLHKRPGDLDLPPWRKGRYGTAIGRAVHGVLQVIDLATGVGLDEAVAAQAAAEGVIGHERRIRTLVRAALAAPTVVEAAALPHWREVHVAVPVGADDGHANGASETTNQPDSQSRAGAKAASGNQPHAGVGAATHPVSSSAPVQTLEGYVDLLYRRVTGLVVVDYKTGPSGPDDDLDALVDRYRLQGASYALAVAEAVGGEPVVDVVFVFLTPKGAVERSLPQLDTAIADARQLIGQGAFTLTS